MAAIRFLLDTNIISQPTQAYPNPGALARLRRYEGEVAISATVWQELMYGWYKLAEGSKKDKITRFLKRLRTSIAPLLPYDQRAARWHGEQRARLRARTPAPFDSEIAAVAAVNNLILVTDNTDDFLAFDDLRIENWMA